MIEVETLAVDFRLLGVERVHSRGNLAALAIVEIDVGGIVIILQGVRVLREANGTLAAHSPAFRNADGQWRSAVILPNTLRTALGAEVLAAFADVAA